MRKIEGSFVALLFAGLGVAGVTYAARPWMPEVASKHGVGIDAMLNYLLVTVGGMFLISWVTLAYFVWKGSRRTAIGPRFVKHRTELLLSATLGLGMAVVAEGGVLAIGMPVWTEYFDAVPPADAVTIDVTAQQFMWNIRYPGPDGVFGKTDSALIDDTANPLGLVPTDAAGKDDIVGLNEFAVPVNRAVRVRLHSKDVIHSFFLPHFRVKQDAVPGMSPEVVFTPTRTGDFELACAELCGLAHYRMRGFVHVLTEPQFKDWLTLQSAAAK